jgi:SAM-dependent methyltransferase
MNILNLGAGNNPITSVINIDVRLFQGVNVVASADQLPFQSRRFDKIFSHNPYDYNPVSKEVAEKLKPNGILIITGQPRNQFIKDILDMSCDELIALGLELVEKAPITPSLIVGTPKTTKGKPLSTKTMIQLIYRKIK